MSVLSSLSIAIVSFLCGLLASDFLGFGHSDGVTKIQNNTEVVLSNVKAEIDSCGQNTTVEAKDLRPGATVEFRYLICGEGGLILSASLAAGPALGCMTYVESGYRAIATVTNHQIACE